MKKLRPLSHALIVDDNLRLRKECGESIRNAELLSTKASVVSAPRTPAIKQCSVTVQLDDVPNNGWDGNTLAACTANKGVIDIDVYAKRPVHKCSPMKDVLSRLLK